MYNVVLLNLILNLNPNDLMLLLINVIWVGHIICSYAKENSITKKGKEVLNKLEETIKKGLNYVRDSLTQIKSFFKDICKNIFNNILCVIKKFHNIYQCLYYTINNRKIQLFISFIKCINQINKVFEGKIPLLHTMITIIVAFVTTVLNILFYYKIEIKGEISMQTILAYSGIFSCIVVITLVYFEYLEKEFKKEELNIKEQQLDNLEVLLENNKTNYFKKIKKFLKKIFFISFVLICSMFKLHEIELSNNLQKQEKIQKEKLITIYTKYSDYYLEFIKMDYNNIPEKVFDWGSHNFIIKKDDKTHNITFQLVDKETNQVLQTDTYKKDLY